MKRSVLPGAVAFLAAVGVLTDYLVYRSARPLGAVVTGDMRATATLNADGVSPTVDTVLVGGPPATPADWMRITIVVLILIAALWVVLSKKYDDADRKWAYGAIGAILGYALGSAVPA